MQWDIESKEFSETLRNVSKTLKEVKSIEEKAQLKKTENKTSEAEVIKEIEKFQKEMNERIEQLKQELVTEADLHRKNREQEVYKISDSCAKVYSELKQVHTNLTDCQTKQFDAQAFVTMEQAQWNLSSTNVPAYELDLTNVLTTRCFEPSKELTNILSQQYGLGRIICPLSSVEKNKPEVGIGKSTDACVTVTQESATILRCIKQKKTINVGTESDKTDCYITGCAVISADRLLLADYWNAKLKIVNTDTHTVLEEMSADQHPWNVTVLPGDQVAVTFPLEQKIMILKTARKLKVTRNMNVGKKCWGIAYFHDYLYVVCQDPNSLLVMGMLGTVQKDIPLQTAQDQTFNRPLHIAVGKDGPTLYISDWQSHFVASLTLNGSVTGVYTYCELQEPRGLVVLEDGSLLVCCCSPGTIHHIFAGLKQGRTMIREVPNVESVCCHPGNLQIYVGASGKDNLCIFDSDFSH